MSNDHIHTHYDGRGLRRVFVNGNEIEQVICADTKRGVVIYAPEPIRIAKGKDYVYRRKLRGLVTVTQL